MRKILFFLFITNTAFAQVDSLKTHPQDTLGLKQKELGDVVINSTRAGANSPTAVQYIGKEQLNQNNLGQDLPYLLDNTPSAVTTSDAGTGIGYTGIRIRGSDNTRVNVTLNGIPVNDGESQGTYWVDLPDVVSSVQSIQIQRGVGTSTNGPGAFGGSLNLQTQTPSQKAFGEAAISGGSFGTIKMNGKAGTGLIKNRFFIEGSGSYVASNGYIDRATSNLRSWFAQAGYMYNGTMLKLLYFGGREKTYQAWDGVLQDSLATNRTYNDLGTDYGQHYPPYQNQTDNYGQDYFQLLFAKQLPKNLYLNANLFATLGRGYYEEYKVGQDFNSYFPGYDTGAVYTDLVRQKWLKNIYYGGTFGLTYEHKLISATLGGLLSQYRGENFGKVITTIEPITFDNSQYYYDGHSTKNDFTVYAKFNYNLLEKVNLYADVQYRYVGYTTNGTDDGLAPYSINRTWNFVNPKAGVYYKINRQHSVYASYAMGNREPNRDDLMADVNTKNETLHDVELGYRGQVELGDFCRWLPAVNFYYMNYKNQLVLTGRLTDVGNPIKENVPHSYRAGIEFYGGFSFTKHLAYTGPAINGDVSMETIRRVFAINYSLTYSINKIKSFDEYIYTYDENYVPIDNLTEVINHKNTDISFSPNIVASLELVAYPVKGLSISLMNKAVSKQYLDNTQNSDRVIKAFYYSNINITYSIPLKRNDKFITLTLMLNNIFNHLYESNGYTYSERYAYLDENNQQQVTPVSTYNYYNPQAGFNVLAGVRVRF